MKVQHVDFYFRGWSFAWEPNKDRRKKNGLGEPMLWRITIKRHTGEEFIWWSGLKVPSACGCRRIKRRILREK